MRREPLRALLDDVANPEQRLDVLHQRRPAEHADLRDVRRAMPRQPALALDRFDHRGFFAADVGAGAAPQMHFRVRRETRRFRLRDLVEQHQAQFGIFVAQIEEDFLRLDHPGGEQHAFDETMRIEAEIVAILERAGLALVAVHRHQPRSGLGAHQRPFAPGRKARAAEPAQARIAHRRDDFLACALAVEAILQQTVAFFEAIERDVLRRPRRMRVRAMRERPGDFLRRRAASSAHGRPRPPARDRTRPCTARARRERRCRESREASPASSSAPAIAHERLSQTRTVTAGGASTPSFTTSKCA